jgi:2,3-diphosphopglycerate-independent phosphoglycerate mutase
LNTHSINVERKAQGKTYTNIILLRGCGKRFICPSFEEMHQMKGFMIAPTAIIKGIGMHIDLDIYDVEGATGWYDSNYGNKFESAEKLLKSENYDFGFVHIKAVDDAGHDKNADLKVGEQCNLQVEILEKVDKALGKTIKKLGQ